MHYRLKVCQLSLHSGKKRLCVFIFTLDPSDSKSYLNYLKICAMQSTRSHMNKSSLSHKNCFRALESCIEIHIARKCTPVPPAAVEMIKHDVNSDTLRQPLYLSLFRTFKQRKWRKRTSNAPMNTALVSGDLLCIFQRLTIAFVRVGLILLKNCQGPLLVIIMFIQLLKIY